MANREACELYIEQEIKDALKAGKKPWSIGKELSGWVEKLFEVTINPRTIEKRARVIIEKEVTPNGVKKSNTATKSPTYEPIHTPSKPPVTSVTSPPTERGGAREGAGRPKLKHTETYDVTDAQDFATMAISQLERIKFNDINRIAALKRVVAWCKKEIDK